MRTREIAAELTALNAGMRREKRNYILIGYGRWGSSVESLGVPVKWSDISEAKVIVECSLDNFRVEPSQGTHFFLYNRSDNLIIRILKYHPSLLTNFPDFLFRCRIHSVQP